MLLTLTNTRSPATDLGFLLHKHPDRAQAFDLSFGTARVFYPRASEACCTAALLFEPLGYAVQTTRLPLDEGVPEWGESAYVSLTLSAQVRVQDLLSHLYVLLPVLDNAKHYLNEARIQEVIAQLEAAGVETLVDLGCGDGRLLSRLIKRHRFTRLVGLDVSVRALEIAALRLRLDRLPPRLRERVELLHGGLTYRDARIEGFGAATLIEVIEHLDPDRLAALERVLFGCARPRLVIVTTPNVEYNLMYETLPPGKLRHPDHRFEWTRAESPSVCAGSATPHGPTATSARTSYATRSPACTAPGAVWSARVSATCMCCARPRRSTRSPSSANPCGTTNAASAAPSTSSATCTGVSMSWRRSSTASATVSRPTGTPGGWAIPRAAGWSSPTRVCVRRCTAAARAGCVSSRSPGRPPARPTPTGCRSATTGRPSIAAGRRSSMATPRHRAPSG